MELFPNFMLMKKVVYNDTLDIISFISLFFFYIGNLVVFVILLKCWHWLAVDESNSTILSQRRQSYLHFLWEKMRKVVHCSPTIARKRSCISNIQVCIYHGKPFLLNFNKLRYLNVGSESFSNIIAIAVLCKNISNHRRVRNSVGVS